MQKGSGVQREEQPSPTGMMAWLGFGCSCFALVCLAISFCSPFWLQTWPMSENRFKNMGLWHVCFYKYMQFKDDSQQMYSECWWVFSGLPKYYKLREWLTPPWFITCQVLTAGSLMIEIMTTISTGLIFLHCCPLMNHEYLQTYGMFAAGSMMFLATMILFVVGILFGWQVNDRYWLPRPDQNYLSWGFGFMVISMIFALVTGILLFKAAWDCYKELLDREDEYTRQALEMSAAGVELSAYPNEDELALVHPGFSNSAPGFGGSFGRQQQPPPPEKDMADLPAYGQKPSYGRPPSYTIGPPSLSPTSIPTSEEKVALMPKSQDPDMWAPVKPVPEKSYDPPDFGAAAAPGPRGFDSGLGQPAPFAAFGYDQPAGFGGKSYEQPPKYGKSYDKNYERRYSDSSFNEEDSIGPAKPERQY